MITSLLRLLPMILMIFGVMRVLKKSDRFVSATKQVVVQSEISDILRFIHLDAIDGPQGVPTSQGFADYLRRNMKTDGHGASRDVSLDLWQSPYQIEMMGNRVIVKSAGPDRVFGSADDIASGLDIAY